MLKFSPLHWILLSISALVAVYFSIHLSKELFSYLSLTNQAPAKVSQWEIENVKENFALKATYSLNVDDRRYVGSYRFSPPYFWNEPAALTALNVKAKEKWLVWYDPSCPERSALEKSFPYSLLIRTLVCYAVLIYFFIFNRKLFKN